MHNICTNNMYYIIVFTMEALTASAMMEPTMQYKSHVQHSDNNTATDNIVIVMRQPRHIQPLCTIIFCIWYNTLQT